MKILGKSQIYLLFFLFGFVVILLNFTINYMQIGSDIEEKFVEDSQKTLFFNEALIKNRISHYKTEIKTLSQSPFVSSFVQVYKTKNKKSIELMDTYMMDLAKAHTDMMQIRYINGEGDEVVRVDRTNLGELPQLISSKYLQNKASRYYFSEISNMQEGSVWYSQIDLNIEHGKIEVPYKPTLRVGMPIFIKGQRHGMIIVNIFMKALLQELEVSKDYSLYLTDAHGNFLLHPNDKHNWSAYLGNGYTLFDEFPKRVSTILKNGPSVQENMFSKVLDFGQSSKYYLIAVLNNDALEAQRFDLIKNFF